MSDYWESSDVGASMEHRIRSFCRLILSDSKARAKWIHRTLSLMRQHDFAELSPDEHIHTAFSKLIEATREIFVAGYDDRLIFIIYLLKRVEGFTLEEITGITHIQQNKLAELDRSAERSFNLSERIRVLVIEDEPLIAFVMADELQRMRHAVIGVTDSVEGSVLLAEQRAPQLIIADICLADGSGVNAVKRINMTLGPLPVIFVTGNTISVRGGKLKNSTLLLGKPYPFGTLTAYVNCILNRNIIASVLLGTV